MEVEVLGKKYKVLEVIYKKNAEHDLFVCQSPLGYKECFQRFDIGRELKEKKFGKAITWTYEEIKIIEEAIKNKLSTAEICKLVELNRHTELAIRNKVMVIKQKATYDKESKPRFNIKF